MAAAVPIVDLASGRQTESPAPGTSLSEDPPIVVDSEDGADQSDVDMLEAESSQSDALGGSESVVAACDDSPASWTIQELLSAVMDFIALEGGEGAFLATLFDKEGVMRLLPMEHPVLDADTRAYLLRQLLRRKDLLWKQVRWGVGCLEYVCWRAACN